MFSVRSLSSECDAWVLWERVWVTALLWPTAIGLGSSAALNRAQMIPPLAFLPLRSFVLRAFHADCFKAVWEMQIASGHGIEAAKISLNNNPYVASLCCCCFLSHTWVCIFFFKQRRQVFPSSSFLITWIHYFSLNDVIVHSE